MENRENARFMYESPLSLQAGDPLMKYYRDQARRAGVRPEADLREGKAAKDQVVANSFINISRFREYVVKPTGDIRVAYAFFNSEGVLCDLFGGREIVRKLQADGIAVGTRLDLLHTGPNAVSVGLAEKRRANSAGEDHYNRTLQSYAISFAPIAVYSVEPPFIENMMGGAAVFALREEASPDHALLAANAALTIISEIHHYQRHYRRYQMIPYGLLTLDTFSGEQPVIRNAEPPLFEILGIPEKKYDGKPARNLINPLPQNPVFWKLLSDMEEVKDKSMTITIGKKNISCTVTTDAYYQPAVGVTGMHFFISTPQWVSKDVSSKVGNNAILSFDNIIGESAVMRSAVNRARLMANTDSNILIIGESGVGKDVFAQAVHNSGKRAGKPFVAVNCGALSRDLILSELFGYEGGAFTGANRQGNIGKFELANGGTLFLDEIGELPMDLQATLLRAVETKRITRLGGKKEIDVDARIISATNVDLPDMIEKKQFREDLYFRLSTFELRIPPLRARQNDAVVLAEYFVRRSSAKYEKPGMTLSEEARSLIASLPWKGNVRELQNLLEGAVQLYPEGEIGPQQILENMRSVSAYHWENYGHVKNAADEYASAGGAWQDPAEPAAGEPGKYTDTWGTEERRTEKSPRKPLERNRLPRIDRRAARELAVSREDVQEALEKSGNNRSEAAERLGISRRTLYRYLDRFGML